MEQAHYGQVDFLGRNLVDASPETIAIGVADQDHAGVLANESIFVVVEAVGAEAVDRLEECILVRAVEWSSQGRVGDVAQPADVHRGFRTSGLQQDLPQLGPSGWRGWGANAGPPGDVLDVGNSPVRRSVQLPLLVHDSDRGSVRASGRCASGWAVAWRGAGSPKCAPEELFRHASVPEPRWAPDTMETPAETLEHLLPQAVAVAGNLRRVVRRPIALDTDHVAARVVRVEDPDVDAVAGGADLRHRVVPPRADRAEHLLLQRRLRFPSGRAGSSQDRSSPVLCVREIRLKCRKAAGGVGRSKPIGGERAHHVHPVARSCHRDVEPTPSARLVHRPEVHRHLPSAIGSVADAQNDDVAVVALHVLEVLDEEAVEPVRPERSIQLRVRATQPVDRVLDGLRLRARQRDHTDGEVRALSDMVRDDLRDLLGFPRVVLP